MFKYSCLLVMKPSDLYAPSMGVGVHCALNIVPILGDSCSRRLCVVADSTSVSRWWVGGTRKGRLNRKARRDIVGPFIPKGTHLAFIPTSTSVNLNSLKTGSQDVLSVLPSFEVAASLLRLSMPLPNDPLHKSIENFHSQEAPSASNSSVLDLSSHFEAAILSHFVATEVSRHDTYQSHSHIRGVSGSLAKWWGASLPTPSQLLSIADNSPAANDANFMEALKAARVARAAVLGVYRSRLSATSSSSSESLPAHVLPTSASHSAALQYIMTSALLLRGPEGDDSAEGTSEDAEEKCQMSIVPFLDLLTNVVVPTRRDTEEDCWVPIDGNVCVEMTTAATLCGAFGRARRSPIPRLMRSRRGIAAPLPVKRSLRSKVRWVRGNLKGTWWWAVTHGRVSWSILSGNLCWVACGRPSSDEVEITMAGVLGGKHRLFSTSSPDDKYFVVTATRDVQCGEVLLLNGITKGKPEDSAIGGPSKAELLVRHGLV